MAAAFGQQERRRRRWPWLLVALVAVAAVAFVAASHGHGHARGRVAPSRPVAPPAPAPASSGPALPRVALSDLGWIDYHGVRLPVSSQDGPHDQRNDLAAGFSDTPRGALLAALHIGIRANPQWGAKVFGPTIAHQVIGPDAASLLANCHTYYDQARNAPGQPAVRDGQPLGPAYATEEGFRWQAYTPTEATIDVLTAAPGPNAGTTVRASTRLQLQWRAGDWRLVAPPGGNWGSSAAVVTDTSSYTLFPSRGAS